MKILKHGKAFCSCGNKIKYKDKEVKWGIKDYGDFFTSVPFIVCPKCGNIMNVSVKNRKLAINPLTNSFNSSIIKE